MRSLPFRAAFFALFVMSGVPLVASEPVAATGHSAGLPSGARAAAAAVDAFHAALHNGNAQAATALLADDAIIFEEGGAERSKAEYVARHLPADVEFSKAVASRVTRRTGDSSGVLAWIASEGRMTGAYHGRTIDQATTETMVLRRSGHRWKIVHIHWSSARR